MTEISGVICARGVTAYTWQDGDTLARVALENATTQKAIYDANEGLDPTTLKAGDVICVPPAQLTCVGGERYIVQTGDTYRSIARAAGITPGELSTLNPYVDPSQLVVGQILCLPEKHANGTVPDSCPIGTSNTVQYGQTFADILIRENISYRTFTRLNPALNPMALIPGQRYCVPTRSVRTCPTGSARYTIAAGGSLDSVAEENGVTKEVLLWMNPDLAPSDFTEGRVICL